MPELGNHSFVRSYYFADPDEHGENQDEHDEHGANLKAASQQRPMQSQICSLKVTHCQHHIDVRY